MEKLHEQFKCSVHFGSVAFYDSALEFTPEVEFTTESGRRIIVKRDRKVTLPVGNQVDFVVDFYLNEDIPGNLESTSGHIIEGIIAVPSGELYFQSWVNDIAWEVAMKKGNYKFYICLSEFDEIFYCYTHCRIFFTETDDPETNDVKIIKQSDR